MISLLDANVLIALFDEYHDHHLQAHQWFREHRSDGWATCPLTQNACIRVISQPTYPRRLPVSDIARRLAGAVSAEDHNFWGDTISLCDPELFDHRRILTPKYLTDLYLLALAVNQRGRLVTFDQGIVRSTVRHADAGHLLIL